MGPEANKYEDDAQNLQEDPNKLLLCMYFLSPGRDPAEPKDSDLSKNSPSLHGLKLLEDIYESISSLGPGHLRSSLCLT